MNSERMSEGKSDYSIEYSRDEKGRLKKKAVYTGPDFYYALPEEYRNKAKKILAAFIASDLVFTLIPLLIPDPLMHKWYTSAPLIICLLGDIHLLMGLYVFLRAKEPLKREETKNGFERIAIWSLLNTIFSFTSVTGQIIWHVKNGFLPIDTLITVSTFFVLVFSVLICKAKGCAEAKESGEKQR